MAHIQILSLIIFDLAVYDERVEEAISEEYVILEGEFEIDGERWPILRSRQSRNVGCRISNF
jgi:hypothetical protein